MNKQSIKIIKKTIKSIKSMPRTISYLIILTISTFKDAHYLLGEIFQKYNINFVIGPAESSTTQLTSIAKHTCDMPYESY